MLKIPVIATEQYPKGRTVYSVCECLAFCTGYFFAIGVAMIFV